MKRVIFFFGLLLFISCTESRMGKVDFLIGTWRVESTNQYESWTKDSINGLTGYSYEMRDGQEKHLESLAIKMIGNQITYEATVPDQNDGKTIQFTLNTGIKSYFSFENPDHDFPKKIQYHKISNNEITIRVSGDDGEGFSYQMIRQE